jgi:hypothetical protein
MRRRERGAAGRRRAAGISARFSPDLVVMKEGDYAVVVIKTREEVIDSNDILDEVERVRV